MVDVHEMYANAEKMKDDGQYEEAISKLEEILKVEEMHVLSHLALAVLYGKLDRHEDALRHGQRACEIDPNDAFHFTALSVAYQRASQTVDNAADNQRYIMLAEQAMDQARRLEASM